MNWSQPHDPVGIATLKAVPEDFRVWEILPFEPTGSGEFLLLQIEKTGWNTAQVSEWIARRFHLPFRAVSFAGRKDRNAVTTQWFCLHLPGKPDPDLDNIDEPGLKLIKATRHQKKLRPGALRGNRFDLVLRDVKGVRQDVDVALDRIASTGVPNYFGSQRFGAHQSNLDQARALAGGARLRRNARSMALSAARSWIFNALLDARIRRGWWNEPHDGDVFMFADGRTCFGPEPWSETLQRRYEAGEIDITGPLWGRGRPPVSDAILELECEVAGEHVELQQCVEAAGMEQERRRLRLRCQELVWQWEDDTVRLRFALEKGTFATSILAAVFEIMDTRDEPK